jgi:hypothetical protein
VLDVSNAPPAIKDLAGWLADEGFITVRETISDPGNQDVFFESRGRIVHLNATRGDWIIGIGLYGMATTFHPDTWESWIAQVPSPDEGSDFAHRVDYIKGNWSAAIELATFDPDAEAQLKALDDDWVERRFGFRRRRGMQ